MGVILQLWDKDMKNCKKKYLPKFNYMVVFGTTDFSNHGHPDALTCPDFYQENLLLLTIIMAEKKKLFRQLKNMN